MSGSKTELSTLTFQRGALHLGAKSLQEFEGYKDPECSAQPKTGRMAALLTYLGTEKDVPIDSGQRLYLLAKTSAFSTGPARDPGASYAIIKDVCMSLVSFTPQSGKRYLAIHEASGVGCAVTITDITSGSPPDDLILEKTSACQSRAQ